MKRIAKKEEKCIGTFRTFTDIENKYQNDIIWIIWDLLLKRYLDSSVEKIIKSLLNLYCIKYTPNVKTKRIYILYYAVTLCCEKINNNITLFSNKNLIENVCSKIDLVYKEIKKNEKSPETDYLFNKVEKK